MNTKTTILGVPTDQISLAEVEEIIAKKISENREKKPLFLVTAYSEFFLEAQTSVAFANALKKADYILPDGVSVLQAADYLRIPKSSIVSDFLSGLTIGLHSFQGRYASRTTGVGLVKKLLQEKEYKIFLVGGWNGVAEKLAKKYEYGFSQGPHAITKATEEENRKLCSEINAYKPDIVLVSFGRFNQEIWIANNLEKLQAKVVIGVGSAFDELLGEGKWSKQVPRWVETVGLKWLWRVTVEPSHIKRLVHIPQFAWSVFMQKVSSN